MCIIFIVLYDQSEGELENQIDILYGITVLYQYLNEFIQTGSILILRLTDCAMCCVVASVSCAQRFLRNLRCKVRQISLRSDDR